MLKLIKYKIIFLIIVVFSTKAIAQNFKYENDKFILLVDSRGNLSGLINKSSDINYKPDSIVSPLLAIKIDGHWSFPDRAEWDANKKLISLKYNESGVKAMIKVSAFKQYLKMELKQLSQPDQVEAVVWGPYANTISAKIGEVIGVVRNSDFAIGIQAINLKTLGGVIHNDEGSEINRGSAAIVQPYGSSLQAYSLNRSNPRTIDVWCEGYPHFSKMNVAPIYGETTIGSAIALFGCKPNEVLKIISEIELSEKLPHPMANGKWIKESEETGYAYMITDFTERNFDTLLNYASAAGMAALYHEGPFQSWGHYILDPNRFPNGNAGMRKCVEKANPKGIRVGVHTLTTFITTNDPYVSPVPDSRLAVTGTAFLINDIDINSTEITVSSPEFFNNKKSITLNAFRIGDEIVRFESITDSAPYKLQNCKRGAFSTKATNHKTGDEVKMLLDYPYEVFFPNFELQQEIAGNLTAFFNETGVSQLDFDGHEGTYSSGQGDYAMQAFAHKVFMNTNHNLVNGSSRSGHYYWHISHYWNWGEPWYGGFRQSQGDYRIGNQAFLERNYMPNMLGWFLLSSTTTIEDIEWMMSRAAGFNAGFALVARMDGLRNNPQTDKLLATIKLWQTAYHDHLFTDTQRELLKNPENDFHLEKDSMGYRLFPVNKHTFIYTHALLQPGQPNVSNWKFTNQDTTQMFKFTITLLNSELVIMDPYLELDNGNRIDFTGKFTDGCSIVSDGTKISIYNDKGRFLRNLPLEKPLPQLTKGDHNIKFGCKYENDEEGDVKIVIKTTGVGELLRN